MKLAITADVHLTAREAHPERYHALEDILQQMLQLEIRTLVVAGDLFDQSSRNYAEFERFCQRPEYRALRFILLPGNHDALMSREFISAENVEVISEPTVRTFAPSPLRLLLLPYKAEKTMGEVVAECSDELPENTWVLIGHGDWSGGIRVPNPLEPGVYMPLTRADVETFRPHRVILGHIHKPGDEDRVHYVGSPCGLDVTETGKRRFLVLDLETGQVESRTVRSDFIYQNESFVILPLADESAYVRQQVEERIKSWGLDEAELPRVRVAVKFRGYTSDKAALMQTVKEAFGGLRFYRDWEPDLSQVAVSDDLNLAEIANRASDWIAALDWQPGPEDPDKDQILLEALQVIYER